MKRFAYLIFVFVLPFVISGCCIQAEPWPTLYFSLSQNKAMQGETITLDMNLIMKCIPAGKFIIAI